MDVGGRECGTVWDKRQRRTLSARRAYEGPGSAGSGAPGNRGVARLTIRGEQSKGQRAEGEAGQGTRRGSAQREGRRRTAVKPRSCVEQPGQAPAGAGGCEEPQLGTERGAAPVAAGGGRWPSSCAEPAAPDTATQSLRDPEPGAAAPPPPRPECGRRRWDGNRPWGQRAAPGRRGSLRFGRGIRAVRAESEFRG